MSQETHWADLQRAKKNFLNGTGHPEEVVRKEVLDSWKRSRAYHIDTNETKKKILSAVEIEEHIMKNRTLYDTAASFLDYLYQIVKGSGFILLFADREGYVLKAVGDPDIIETARRQDIPLTVGSCRLESVLGTNAIGTPLYTGQPIQLYSYEHYFDLNANWTCSGAPIRLDNEVLGVICLSGSWKNAHIHTLGMVMSAAEAIARQYRLTDSNDHLTAMRNQLQTSIDSIHNGVLLLDEKYNVSFINAVTIKEFNFHKDEMLAHSYREFFPDLDLERTERSAYNIETRAQGKYVSFTCYVTVKRVRSSEYSSRESYLVSYNKTEYLQQLATRIMGSNARYTFRNIIGSSQQMERLKGLARQAAQETMNILITGENGTGKEMFAQSIHNQSPYAAGSFVTVNCGAIPKDLIAGELFGYEKGANDERVGKLELANGGTIFIDEINEMPHDVQSQLLRVLQDNAVCRIGGTTPIPLNVRFIAATSVPLERSLKNRTFNSDLYYRLNVFSLHIPPLRERGDDILKLTDYYIQKYADPRYDPILAISEDVKTIFRAYDWPGNVRELENVIERACILTTNGIMTANALPSAMVRQSRSEGEAKAEKPAKAAQPLEAMTAAEAEKMLILDHLTNAGGNIKKASDSLGISRRTLYRKLEKYEIDPNRIRFIAK